MGHIEVKHIVFTRAYSGTSSTFDAGLLDTLPYPGDPMCKHYI